MGRQPAEENIGEKSKVQKSKKSVVQTGCRGSINMIKKGADARRVHMMVKKVQLGMTELTLSWLNNKAILLKALKKDMKVRNMRRRVGDGNENIIKV